MSDDTMTSTRAELEVEQLRASINKIIAETAKINSERIWYPLVIASAIVGGITTGVLTLMKAFA